MMHEPIEQKLYEAPCLISPIDNIPSTHVPFWHKKIKHCVYSSPPTKNSLFSDDDFLSNWSGEEKLVQ
jgi:hypothetical protein